MYADPKLIRSKRIPVYLNNYVHERLARIVEMTGGETSVVSRNALERGLDLLEQELHGLQCGRSGNELRGALSAFVRA